MNPVTVVVDRQLFPSKDIKVIVARVFGADARSLDRDAAWDFVHEENPHLVPDSVQHGVTLVAGETSQSFSEASSEITEEVLASAGAPVVAKQFRDGWVFGWMSEITKFESMQDSMR